MENVYDARKEIESYDPLLAQQLSDPQALVAARIIRDSRTAGISAGVFWGVVLAVVAYMGYKALAGGSLRGVFESGE